MLEFFIPLVSSSYLASRYSLRSELKVAWRLWKKKKLDILPVNVAYDGVPPADVREIVEQIQYLKWKGEHDTDELCREIASRLPAPEELVKGMRAFVHADHELFSRLGREHEVADFISLFGERRSPYVLLHGVSGSGKTSFLSAGVLPRLGAPPSAVVEMTADADGSFSALASAGSPLLVLDQFEQSLIRFAKRPAECRAFEDAAEAWVAGGEGRRIIFCLRDEYRTSFDAMLPRVAPRCRDAHFALLPLRPDAAWGVLELLLKNARVEYDIGFLSPLCANYLAEGVPKSVLPALLQMVAHYWRGRGGRLDKAAWERLTAGDTSVFKEHIRGAVLERLPRRLTLEAAQSLAALAEGAVKTRRKSAEEIAADHQLDPAVVKRTMETASQPHARVVAAESEADGPLPRYRLIHDLFVPAVQSLRRDAQFAREGRRRKRLVGLFATLTALSVAAGALAWWQRGVAERQRNEAFARQLAAQSDALRAGDAGSFMRSVLFAAEAHRRFPTVESDAAVRASLSLSPLHTARLEHLEMVRAQPQFSRDGTLLAAGGSGGEVRVWDFDSRRVMADFEAGTQVNSIAFRHDGGAVAAGAGSPLSNDGVAVAWDMRDRRELVRMHFASPVTDVAFVRDTGRLVAVANDSAKVLSTDGSPPVTIEFGPSERRRLTVLSRDGGLLAVGQRATVEVYELPTGRLARTLRVEEPAFATRPARAPRPAMSKFSKTMVELFWPLQAEESDPTTQPGGAPRPTTATLSEAEVLGLAFNADGTRLAVASGSTLNVWEVMSGRPLFRAASHSFSSHSMTSMLMNSVEPPSFLVLSDDGTLVADTADDGTTQVWAVGTEGEPVAVIEPYTKALSPFWLRTLPTFRHGSHDLFTPTGRAARMHRLVRANAQPGDKMQAVEMLRLMPGVHGLTAPLVTSPDGRFAVTVEYYNLDVWELKGTSSIVESPDVRRAVFSPSGRFFVAQRRDGKLEVFDLAKGGGLHMSLEEVGRFAVGAGDRLAVTVRRGDSALPFDEDALGEIEIYDLSTQARVRQTSYHVQMRDLLFSSDGQSLLFSSVNDRPSLFDSLFSLVGGSLWQMADGGEAVEVFKSAKGSEVGFSPGGRYFYRITREPSPEGKQSDLFKTLLEVFETAGRRKVLSTPIKRVGSPFSFSFSRDDQYLVAKVEEDAVVVWETDGGRMLRRFPASGVFTKDAVFWGDTLLAVGNYGTVSVWNVRTGEQVANLRHDEVGVESLSFNPTDGRHLLTTCEDGKARIWNLSKGVEEAIIEGVEPEYKAVFSPDGKHILVFAAGAAGLEYKKSFTDIFSNIMAGSRYIVAGDRNKTMYYDARVLLWRREDLLGEVCRRVARNFTEDEWVRYTGFAPDAPTCPNLP